MITVRSDISNTEGGVVRQFLFDSEIPFFDSRSFGVGLHALRSVGRASATILRARTKEDPEHPV